MAKINVLTPDIYNLIAAGEVVERPSSVVKELIENSLDAGAENITISIENGGTTLIQVADDGCGIDEKDIEKAFLPHATSKISSAEDLEKILTLGFRGEALASISAVSKVTLVSKTKDAETGVSLKVSGGVFGDKIHKSSKNGTTITVEDLFYCVPARAKFLKKNKTEEQEITNIVSRSILAHPDVKFSYFVDGKQNLSSLGKTLKEAIFSIYGKEAVTETLEVSAKREGVSVYGYVGKPTFSKSNRTYQTLIVNGRYVINLTVQMAVANAYGDFLMKRQYPFFVLSLTVPEDEVDVNVHPNKLDVKFLKTNLVYSVVFEAVSRALHEMDYVKEIEIDENNNSAISVDTQNGSNSYEFNLQQAKSGSVAVKTSYQSTGKRGEIDKAGVNLNPFSADFSNMNGEQKNKMSDIVMDAVLDGQIEEKVRDNFGLGSKLLERINRKVQDSDSSAFISSDYIDDENIENSNITGSNSKGTKDAVQKLKNSEPLKENEKEYAEGFEDVGFTRQKSKQEDFAEDEFKVVGKFFNTYLVVEWGESIYLFDQHAAHERLRYEKLKAEYESGEIVIQPMLVPYVLSLNAQDDQIVNENLEAIRSVGFEISEFGDRTYKISAVPAIVSDVDFNKFFGMFLAEKLNKQKLTSAELVKDELMQMACKSAIKGGNDLSQKEIYELFKQMSENKITLFCPHGRPVVVRVTKTEIEKWFKRIV